MANAADRIAWLHDIAAPLNAYVEAHPGTNPPEDHEIWATYLKRVAEEGPALGRTNRWQTAVAWHAARVENSDPAPWIVLQGSVYLNHAAD